MLKAALSFNLRHLRFVSVKTKLKDYKFPEIRNEDCEQHYMSGWGPGGQKVNTAQNAVQMRHIPTGIIVKIHESRLLSKNVEIAFERIKHAVDRHLNGDNCYEEQYKRLLKEKGDKAKKSRDKHRKLKEEYQQELDAQGQKPWDKTTGKEDDKCA
ncbi:unnamed protein product, partial [Mesorhabditis spiculigera]